MKKKTGSGLSCNDYHCSRSVFVSPSACSFEGRFVEPVYFDRLSVVLPQAFSPPTLMVESLFKRFAPDPVSICARNKYIHDPFNLTNTVFVVVLLSSQTASCYPMQGSKVVLKRSFYRINECSKNSISRQFTQYATYRKDLCLLYDIIPHHIAKPDVIYHNYLGKVSRIDFG